MYSRRFACVLKLFAPCLVGSGLPPGAFGVREGVRQLHEIVAKVNP
jgi:hypothetical protein